MDYLDLRDLKELNDSELINEIYFVNHQYEFYYMRKKEIEKEVERRAKK